MDKVTELRHKVRFARVCIKVNCINSLPDSIVVNTEGVGNFDLLVEYAWRPKICTFCKNFGHQDLACTKLEKVWMLKQNTQSAGVVETVK